MCTRYSVRGSIPWGRPFFRGAKFEGAVTSWFHSFGRLSWLRKSGFFGRWAEVVLLGFFACVDWFDLLTLR